MKWNEVQGPRMVTENARLAWIFTDACVASLLPGLDMVGLLHACNLRHRLLTITPGTTPWHVERGRQPCFGRTCDGQGPLGRMDAFWKKFVAGLVKDVKSWRWRCLFTPGFCESCRSPCMLEESEWALRCPRASGLAGPVPVPTSRVMTHPDHACTQAGLGIFAWGLAGCVVTLLVGCTRCNAPCQSSCLAMHAGTPSRAPLAWEGPERCAYMVSCLPQTQLLSMWR
jgi:hypothetical protein